jgi:hypothetical protein
MDTMPTPADKVEEHEGPGTPQTTKSWDVCPVCKTNQVAVSMRVKPKRPRRRLGVFLVAVGVFVAVSAIGVATGFAEGPPEWRWLGIVGFPIAVWIAIEGVRTLKFEEIYVKCSEGHEWEVRATPTEKEEILTQGVRLLEADRVHEPEGPSHARREQMAAAKERETLEDPCEVIVTRPQSFVGKFVSMDVFLNGSHVGVLKNGQTLALTTSHPDNLLVLRAADGERQLRFAATSGGRVDISFKAMRKPRVTSPAADDDVTPAA